MATAGTESTLLLHFLNKACSKKLDGGNGRRAIRAGEVMTEPISPFRECRSRRLAYSRRRRREARK